MITLIVASLLTVSYWGYEHFFNKGPTVTYEVTAINDKFATVNYRVGNSTVTKRHVQLPFKIIVTGTQIPVIIASGTSTATGTSITCHIHKPGVAPIDNEYTGSDPQVICSD